MQIEIKYLADHPHLVPILSNWFLDEWGRNNPTLTMKSIEEAVRGRLNRDRAPLCLVAFLDARPVATGSLKIREMETHPQFEHWLGNIYVLPEYRDQGIGSHVVEKVTDKAKQIGIHDLYLYTRNQEHFYERLGWKIMQQTEYRGHKASIMKKRLTE